VLLAVGVGEGWGAALDRGSEDVDPGCEGHVEWGRVGLVRHLRDDAGKFEFLDEGDGSLEVLMPWDVGKGVIETADGALEEDHAQRGFEDLLVIFVTIESFAKLGNCRISVAHDVVVVLLVLEIHGCLQMLC